MRSLEWPIDMEKPARKSGAPSAVSGGAAARADTHQHKSCNTIIIFARYAQFVGNMLVLD